MLHHNIGTIANKYFPCQLLNKSFSIDLQRADLQQTEIQTEHKLIGFHKTTQRDYRLRFSKTCHAPTQGSPIRFFGEICILCNF